MRELKSLIQKWFQKNFGTLTRACNCLEPTNQQREVEIKVAGTSFTNPSGELRQMILQEIMYNQNIEASRPRVELSRTSFEGELAIGISIGNKMIGFVPKNQIGDIDPLLDRHCMMRYKIVGGGYDGNGRKRYYGARVFIQEAA